ncbi:MAG: DUF362 domain-containing protein [Acidobacteriota bacterium]
MKSQKYRPSDCRPGLDRRDFVRFAAGACAAGSSLVLGVPLFGQGQPRPPEPETNIADFLKTPRTKHSLPGPFPGKVVEIKEPACLVHDKFDQAVINRMVEKGITTLTGMDLTKSFRMFFDKDDVVGLKVNPVGPPLINTRPELIEAVIQWLSGNGIPKKNIVIWDRFDYMLRDAGYTAERFPGVQIEGLQTMDESENGTRWRDASGKHVSTDNFDLNVYYFAKGILGKGVRGYKDDTFYLNQHVFAGEYSYFGKLVTQKLTKIVNLAAYKNTGNGISMATKNLGYGALCNTGRLHTPLFFKVCTEVLAAPVIRDRLVLNITDGLRGQYEDGPGLNAQFVYPNHSLLFATDPFALDMICHRQLVARRKAAGIKVNEHPIYTDYLRYAEKLGLGISDPARIKYELL